MKVAIVAAGFTPRHGNLPPCGHHPRGIKRNDYHAASFALLAYVSSWIKCHHSSSIKCFVLPSIDESVVKWHFTLLRLVLCSCSAGSFPKAERMKRVVMPGWPKRAGKSTR